MTRGQETYFETIANTLVILNPGVIKNRKMLKSTSFKLVWVDLEAEEPTHHETHLHRPIDQELNLIESNSISNSQEGFVHQTKTDNKQPGGTWNLTKNSPTPSHQ